MPRVKITNIPSYARGGTPPNCEPGYMPDPKNPNRCIKNPNQSSNIAPKGFAKDYSSMEFKRTIPTANMQGGFDWNTGNTDINGMSTIPSAPVNPNAVQTYKIDANQKAPDVGLFECPKGYVKDATTGKCVPKPKKQGFFGDMTTQERAGWIGDTANTLITAGNIWATDKANRERKQAYDKAFRFAQFNPAAQPGDDKGYWTADSQHIFQPNQYTVNEGMMNRQFGGLTPEDGGPQKVKIKIIDGPQPTHMEYGGQFKGSYGFDSGWRNLYTDMAKTPSDHYTNTMTEKKNPDEDYALEAEGGEVIYKPGDHTAHTITGPSHAEGGVKLTDSQVTSKVSPDISSFIFSKTKSMAIKDPEILAHFGITKASRGGVVPAKIAKMFEINKYKTIIDDPNKDDLAKSTAALMLDRNEKYLAELAAVHENMKGKEAPEFAKMILGEGQEEGEEQAKYGGWYSKAQGLRKFVEGGPKNPDDIDPWRKKEKTPTGQTNEYSMPPDYLQKWETKIPGISKMSNADAQTAIYDYMLKNHPEKVREMWKTYGLTTQGMGKTKLRRMTKLEKNKKTGKYERTGVFEDVDKLTDEQLKDLKEAYVDAKFGKRQMPLPDEQPKKEEPEKPKITIKPGTTAEVPEEPTKYICVVDGKRGYKIVQAAMGYDTYEEAAANCARTAKEPPFEFTTPDKMAMLAAAAVFPRKDYPTIANRAYERGQYALNDWAAAADRAFNTQFLAPSRAAAAYTSPQGLVSNMSSMSGQAADTIVGNVIPTITGQNVGIFNQFSAQEQQRKDAIDDYNAKAQVARDEGRARTEQMYQQELSDYLTNFAQQYGKAWVNRYKWHDQGYLNPNFYKDPRTGRTVFRNTGGFMGAADSDGSNDVGSLGTYYNSYYKKFYDDMKDIPDPKDRATAAAQMAAKAVGAGRVSTSQKNPYDNLYNTRTRSTSYNLPDETEEDNTETNPFGY